MGDARLFVLGEEKKNKDRDNCMAYDIGVTAKKKPNPAWYMKTAT